MIIKKEQNMEYGIWNMGYGIQFLPNSKFNIPNSNRRGFTLVETLVAISILLIAVVGPISLIGDALHKLYYARDEMVALSLAQEGIEVVRQIRDSNMLDNTGNTWSNLHSNGNPKDGYVVDVGQISNDDSKKYLQKCTTYCPSKKDVFIDNISGLYRQDVSGPNFTLTQFKRLIEIGDSSNNSDEQIITSTVEWKTGGDTGTVTVSENIFDLSP